MIALSVSPHIHNKQVSDPKHWAEFHNVRWQPAQIREHLLSGKAICVAALTTNWRKREHFQSSQLMGADFDQDTDIDDLAQMEFIRQHAFLLYRTPSWTAEHPRSRAMFILDEPLTDGERYIKLLKRLLHHVKIADGQAKDEVRIFFGSDVAGHKVVHDRVLPITALEHLAIHPDELIRQAPPPAPVHANGDKSAYVEKAVQTELNSLIQTGHGRNNALVTAAFNLGTLAAATWTGLSRVDLETRLFNAALANGYVQKDGEGQARRTIQSGLDSGMKQPRPEPTGTPIHVNGAKPLPPPINIMDYVIDDKALMTRYEQIISPDCPPEIEPLIIPFGTLHQFGGYAKVIYPGKLIGVAGRTGGGKTMFVESIVDAWRKAGESCFVYSPEWGADEFAARMGQRGGGPHLEAVYLHQVHKALKARGITQHDLATPLSNHQQTQAGKAATKITDWKGRLYLLDRARLNLTQLLDGIETAITTLRASGQPVRVLVIDYAQMLKVSARDESARTLNDAISLIKDLCIDLKLLGVIVSQVTKQDSREASNGGKLLDENSAQFLRFDEFNLALSLNMDYNDLGEFENTGTINVLKNSTGRRGKVKLMMDTATGSWIDVNAEVVF